MTHMVRFEPASIPPSPGQVLKDRLLDGFDLTQAELARAIGISRPRLNMILKDRCIISTEIALRIEHVFGILPHYWLRIRNEFELFEERRRLEGELERLPRLTAVQDCEESAWRHSHRRIAA